MSRISRLQVPIIMNVSRHFVLVFLAALGLSACGGQAVDNDQRSEPEEAETDQDEEQGDAPDSPTKGSASQQLGECEGGHDPSEAACPWIDSDFTLCFPSKEAACDCICPQDRDSTCVSGFYNGEDGQTPVYCD